MSASCRTAFAGAMLACMARQLHELQLQQELALQEQHRLHQLQQHLMDEMRILAMKLQSIIGVGGDSPALPHGGAALASQLSMSSQADMPAQNCYPLMGATGIYGTLPQPMEASMGSSFLKGGPTFDS